jgi:hypothetical protein
VLIDPGRAAASATLAHIVVAGSAVMTRMRSADPNLAEEILFPREPAHDRTVVMADPGGPPIGIWR